MRAIEKDNESLKDVLGRVYEYFLGQFNYTHLASGEDEPRRAQHRQRHPPEQVRELVAELCQLRA